MITNYLEITIRSLRRFKGYAVINLPGTALGLTAGIMILIHLLDAFSYDQSHSRLARIYRVGSPFVSNRQNAILKGKIQNSAKVIQLRQVLILSRCNFLLKRRYSSLIIS